MFSFPHTLKKHGFQADARTIFDFLEAMQAGLISNLGDLYAVGERVIVKDRRQKGPYTKAFFEYFLGVEIKDDASLDEAVMKSEGYRRLREDFLRRVYAGDDDFAEDDVFEQKPFIDLFLEHSFRSSTQLEAILDGREVSHEIPKMPDVGGRTNLFDKMMSDYSKVDGDKLMQQLREIAKWEREEHRGGPLYAGRYGVSPFGNSGRALGGIRIGGTGQSRLARAVLGDPSFYPVDRNEILNQNNVDAALAALKGARDVDEHEEFDLEETIREGVKRGGLILPKMRTVRDERVKVVLLIDNGGHSMDPHTRMVQDLFKRMKTRFNHDLKVYYFHNSFLTAVYNTEVRDQYDWTHLREVLRFSPDHRVFFVGDAAMSDNELNSWSFQEDKAGKGYYDPYPRYSAVDYAFKNIRFKFPKSVWLNPRRKESWYKTGTIGQIGKVIPMFELSPQGIEESVKHMNRCNDRSNPSGIRIPEPYGQMSTI